MGRRYLEVQTEADPTKPWEKGQRTSFQRSLAQRDRDDIKPLALDFLSSVQTFGAYEPRDEPFHDPPPPLGQQWHEEGNPTTNRLAARIIDAGISVKGDLPELRYLDREVFPPARPANDISRNQRERGCGSTSCWQPTVGRLSARSRHLATRMRITR